MSGDLLGKTLSLLCAFFWASAVLFFKKSGERVTPVTLNLVKNFVAVVLFTITLPLLGVSLIPDADSWTWGVVGASGVLGIALGDALFFASLNRLGAGLTAIVDCLYSPLLIFLSALFLGEPLTLVLVVGAGLAVSAVVLASNPKRAGSIDRRRFVSGFTLGFLGLLSMACSLVMVKPLLADLPVMWVIWWRMAWGFLGLFIWMAAFPKGRKALRTITNGLPWKHVLPGSVIGGYLATIGWLFGMRYTDVSLASVLNQLSTIFILVLAALFLSEPLDRRKVTAAVLGFSGASVIFLPELLSGL
jgi:drug/metabolite transporter (DMT)-like permease